MSELPVSPDDLRALAGLLSPGIVADPYPVYARWRAERPVARPRERLYVLSRFADCEAVLADPAFGRPEEDDARLAAGQGQAGVRRLLARGADGVIARSMLQMNPPDHTRLRRLVSRAFTPARVRELAPRVEALTASLLSGAGNGPDGRFDLISGLALPLPVAVISELLGIPVADRPRLVAWSDALARSLDPGFLISAEDRARQREARLQFAAYLRGLLPSRRGSPGDDLISALIGVHDADGALTEGELIGLCMLLLIAGHETTRSLVGSAVLALLRHPAELAALVADPSLLGPTVEEVLRYDPPVQLVIRFVLRSTEVAGVTIAAGSFVVMLLGAANRDPALCADPDDFSVRRGMARHLSFGHGIHFCLGAPLARLEAATALRQLLPLLPRLRISGEPEWKPNTVLRGLEHLWLEPAPVADVGAR
ncbi:MAG: cytochrome P450 [Trebonia sp.]